MNVQQENKRVKCPPRAKPTQNPLENQEPSYQKGKNMSENWVYRHFGHDKIIFFKFFFDEYSYNTPYLQHCTDKKNSLKIFFSYEILQCSPYFWSLTPLPSCPGNTASTDRRPQLPSRPDNTAGVVALVGMAPSTTSRWRHRSPRLVWVASIIFSSLFCKFFVHCFFIRHANNN